jgi:hypothetical protein
MLRNQNEYGHNGTLSWIIVLRIAYKINVRARKNAEELTAPTLEKLIYCF